MKNYSLEKKLIKHTLTIVSVVLLITGLAVAFGVNYLLEQEYNQHLLAKARLLATLTKNRVDRIELDFADEFMPEFKTGKNPEYFQIWFSDGRLLERSRSLKNVVGHAWTDAPKTALEINSHHFLNVDLPDGRAGRMVQLVFHPQIPRRALRTPENLSKQPIMVVQVVKERESLRDLRYTVYAIYIAAALMALVVNKGLLSRRIALELQPLAQLQRQIETIDTERLQKRLHLQAIPQELTELIDQFNRLMERLQQSFTREQRFSADVAHEMRTPIAEIRSMAEVALRRRADAAVGENFYSDIVDACIHMQHIVDNLLQLARCENGSIVLHPIKVDLVAAVQAAWSHHCTRAGEKYVTLVCPQELVCIVNISAKELDIILNNLLENAVKYCQSHSDIVVDISCDPPQLCISNLTEALGESDLPYIFERMWRKDAARSSSQHAGIGLALVKAYCDLLGLAITANLSDRNKFSVTLSDFPLA